MYVSRVWFQRPRSVRLLGMLWWVQPHWSPCAVRGCPADRHSPYLQERAQEILHLHRWRLCGDESWVWHLPYYGQPLIQPHSPPFFLINFLPSTWKQPFLSECYHVKEPFHIIGISVCHHWFCFPSFQSVAPLLRFITYKWVFLFPAGRVRWRVHSLTENTGGENYITAGGLYSLAARQAKGAALPCLKQSNQSAVLCKLLPSIDNSIPVAP